MRKLLSNTIVLLLLAVVASILAGFFIPEAGMKGVLVLKQISGQIIFFLVPLIIIGFVAPSIASLKGSVSRLIVFAFSLAYLSSVGAAFFAMLVGYQVISLLDIRPVTGSLRELPEVLFSLEIPPMLSVMSASRTFHPRSVHFPFGSICGGCARSSRRNRVGLIGHRSFRFGI